MSTPSCLHIQHCSVRQHASQSVSSKPFQNLQSQFALGHRGSVRYSKGFDGLTGWLLRQSTSVHLSAMDPLCYTEA